jgi:oligoribonuclease (3'-5' exoribonuclease)
MNYLFLDLETTGLDPNVDCILEIAYILVDEEYEPLTEQRSYIVEPENWGKSFALLRSAKRVVIDMHQASGLTADLLDDSQPTATLDVIYKDIDYLIHEYATDKVALAGFSTHFDKDFLVANDFKGLFTGEPPIISHKILDLSAVDMLLADAGVKILRPNNVRPHRALDDVFQSLDHARNLRDHIRVTSARLDRETVVSNWPTSEPF